MAGVTTRRARRRAAALAAAALLLAGACGRPALNLGRTVPGVQADSIALNLVLIGDAGLPDPDGEPVLQALRREVAWDPGRTLVVFLGDNVYPHGLPDSVAPDRSEAERILRGQIAPLVETGARGIFVPGNHDWDAGSPAGWNYVARQDRWIDGSSQGLVVMEPGYGCPGPVVRDEGEVLRLVILDTQWWLHGGPRPEGDRPECGADTEEEVVSAIRVALATAGQRRTVVVGHHPMASGGEHGGYFDWPTYLMPFHPWARLGGFFARQDVSGSEYRHMRDELGRAFAADPPLVYAAGHEHNLQVLRRAPARFLLVSGGGIYNHTTATRAITGTRYVRRASGFMRLTFLHDGRVRLAVIVVDADGEGTEDFSMWLEEERITPPAQGDTTNAQRSTP
jgi:hypothetical protein